MDVPLIVCNIRLPLLPRWNSTLDSVVYSFSSIPLGGRLPACSWLPWFRNPPTNLCFGNGIVSFKSSRVSWISFPLVFYGVIWWCGPCMPHDSYSPLFSWFWIVRDKSCCFLRPTCCWHPIGNTYETSNIHDSSYKVTWIQGPHFFHSSSVEDLARYQTIHSLLSCISEAGKKL